MILAELRKQNLRMLSAKPGISKRQLRSLVKGGARPLRGGRYRRGHSSRRVGARGYWHTLIGGVDEPAMLPVPVRLSYGWATLSQAAGEPDPTMPEMEHHMAEI